VLVIYDFYCIGLKNIFRDLFEKTDRGNSKQDLFFKIRPYTRTFFSNSKEMYLVIRKKIFSYMGLNLEEI